MDRKWIILAALIVFAVGVSLLFREGGASPPTETDLAETSANANFGALHDGATMAERRILAQVRSLMIEKRKEPEAFTAARLQPLIQRAKADPEPTVRATAMTGLATVGHAAPVVIETFLDGLEDDSALVRQRALAALRRTNGRSFKDYQPNAPEQQRREAVKRIRKVFEDAQRLGKDDA